LVVFVSTRVYGEADLGAMSVVDGSVNRSSPDTSPVEASAADIAHVAFRAFHLMSVILARLESGTRRLAVLIGVLKLSRTLRITILAGLAEPSPLSSAKSPKLPR